MSSRRYKDLYSLEHRKEEIQKMILSGQHTDKIPLIIERHKNSKNLSDLPRCKFLFQQHFKIFAISDIIRQKLNYKHKVEALYLFVNDSVLLKGDQNIKELHDKYKDEDGYLYITFSEFATFGQ